jgi:hypothetical protein
MGLALKELNAVPEASADGIPLTPVNLLSFRVGFAVDN